MQMHFWSVDVCLKCILCEKIQRLPAGNQTYLCDTGISALIMGVAVYLSYQLALYLFRVNAIATVFSIFIGVIVYAVVLLLLKGLTEEEILKFPKGAALVRLARKMHLLR